jgi:SAM-dependent methyltransferase
VPKKAVEINLHAHSKLKQHHFEVHETIESVPDSSVDFVISHHSLEHVPFPIAALSEAKRVLKPDGKLILIVPIDHWRSGKKFNPLDINHHLHTWNPQLLGNTLIEAGFKVTKNDIQIYAHNWFPGYHNFYKYVFFDFLCKMWSIIRSRRQIIAIVTKN